MFVLAVHSGHNATAGLFSEGKCLEYHHEERFNDFKNFAGFPYRSVRYLLEKYDPSQITSLVLPHEGLMPYSMHDYDPHKSDEAKTGADRHLVLRQALNFLGRPIPWHTKLFLRNLLLKRIYTKADALLREVLRDKLKLSTVGVHYYDHHTCHALTPVYFYGLDQAQEKTLVITADAGGGDACSKVFIFDPKTKRAEKIAHSYYNASLGYLYALTTQYLGMKPGEHEYKVMGLAAYSSDAKYWQGLSNKLKDLVYVDEQALTFRATVDMPEAMPRLKRIFDEQRFDNISAAVQDTLEDRVLKLTQAAVKKTGIRRVAFSGGVFMNVKMNQHLTQLTEVEKVYFQPSCGDESLGIGAAALHFLDKQQSLQPINSMYTGIRYDDTKFTEYLDKSEYSRGLKVEKVDNINKRIAELLSRFEIVARFDGAGEWGARSLCNRGILANGSDMRSFYMVNDMVKMRDFWMPFAPTIMLEWGDRYIRNWDLFKARAFESLKYMILTVDSTELAQNHLRAAIHQKDKTLRPQMLESQDNPAMYEILKHYESLTGMGGIMNTSFNLHGSPLVGSPTEALATFVHSGLRYMTLGSYLISKS